MKPLCKVTASFLHLNEISEISTYTHIDKYHRYKRKGENALYVKLGDPIIFFPPTTGKRTTNFADSLAWPRPLA